MPTKPNLNNVIVVSRSEADLLVESMSALLERFKVVYLSDLKDLVGLDTSRIDQMWGWTNLDAIEIKQVREGFSINLPPLEDI
jgi:hypothetical protein